MQLHSFERRNSYIFFAILNQTHELFFAPPGIVSKYYSTLERIQSGRFSSGFEHSFNIDRYIISYLMVPGVTILMMLHYLIFKTYFKYNLTEKEKTK